MTTYKCNYCMPETGIYCTVCDDKGVLPYCSNCGGQTCGGCSSRLHPHECVDDCPECCVDGVHWLEKVGGE